MTHFMSFNGAVENKACHCHDYIQTPALTPIIPPAPRVHCVPFCFVLYFATLFFTAQLFNSCYEVIYVNAVGYSERC